MSSKYYYRDGAGVTFIDPADETNTHHTYRDYGLILRSVTAPLPNPRTDFIDVPGRNGSLDLTSPYGEEYVTYEDRTVTITLTDLTHRQGFMARFARLATNILGKRKKIILDKDPSYYYIGRCVSFTDPEVEGQFATSTIVFQCDPYRYSIYDATHPWEWDPFNFYTDMAINAGSYTVSGTLTVTLNVGEKDVYPSITVSADMTLEFEEKSFQLRKGTTTNYDIRLKGGQSNILVFKGNGTATIDYQGGRF